jgi:hypothetical protein
LNSSHRVSFRQELDNTKEYFNDVAVNKNNSDRNELNPKASRSVRVGKADPIRDVGIGVGIFLVLFLVANSFSELGSPRPIDDGVMVKPITKKSTKLQQIKQALGELLQAQSRPHLDNPLRPKNLPCPLLLYPSRIAHSGWGLYAGQNYSRGQEIVSHPSRYEIILCVREFVRTVLEVIPLAVPSLCLPSYYVHSLLPSCRCFTLDR